MIDIKLTHQLYYQERKKERKKEVDVTSDFVEQPIFKVNVLDSSDLKERLDRFEDYAKDIKGINNKRRKE